MEKNLKPNDTYLGKRSTPKQTKSMDRVVKKLKKFPENLEDSNSSKEDFPIELSHPQDQETIERKQRNENVEK